MSCYSQKVINDNKKATPVTPGIKLGKLGIKLMYPAAEIAKKLSTSRQCVDNWFCGKSTPSKNNIEKIHQLITDLTAEEKRCATMQIKQLFSAVWAEKGYQCEMRSETQTTIHLTDGNKM